MKASQLMKEETLIDEAIGVLMKKFGPVETSRFLAIPRPKRTESVRRHRRWQARLDKDTFFDGVFKKRPDKIPDVEVKFEKLS